MSGINPDEPAGKPVEEKLGAVPYEPPQLTLIGNLHDIQQGASGPPGCPMPNPNNPNC